MPARFKTVDADTRTFVFPADPFDGFVASLDGLLDERERRASGEAAYVAGPAAAAHPAHSRAGRHALAPQKDAAALIDRGCSWSTRTTTRAPLRARVRTDALWGG